MLTKTEGHAFCLGSLVACLVFYFMNSLPLKENVVWDENLPIGKQIKRYLDGLNDKDSACRYYFIELQKNMIARFRIPENCVEKYRDSITFLVDTDNCFMEAMMPQNFRLTNLGYEISAEECMLYAKELLKCQVDLTEDKFGTYKELIR